MAKGGTEHIETQLPSQDITWDIGAFNELIRSQGVRLVHYRAQRCPVGMVSMDDNRRPHPHHEGCYNGFIYEEVGCITAAMTGNSKKKSQEEIGFVDFSSVQVSFPQTYDCTDDKFVVAPFDRFYLDEKSANVVMWQLFQTNETGIDRLKYPVECVQGPIIDSRGERYLSGSDFNVTSEGAIQWTGRRPGTQIDVGPGLEGSGPDRGEVCSIRYLYRPYWYVGAIPHELRFAQVNSGFERIAVRAPQMCVLHREFVPQSIEQSGEGNTPIVSQSDELKRVMAPMYGGFAPK